MQMINVLFMLQAHGKKVIYFEHKALPEHLYIKAYVEFKRPLLKCLQKSKHLTEVI